jgi:flagellar protein FlgJ
MSLSLDSITSMLNTTTSTTLANNSATEIQNTVNSVSSDSTDDELLQVCKDFESYFIEEVLKEVKENMTMEDEDEDSSMSTLKDYYMDSVIEEVADEVLDQEGSSFTQTLYEQMKRNYSVDTVTEAEVESAAEIE